MTDNVKNHGVIGRALPGIHQDNTQAAQRFSRYGENDQFLLHDWGASQSGASSYQFRVGFWMR